MHEGRENTLNRGSGERGSLAHLGKCRYLNGPAVWECSGGMKEREGGWDLSEIRQEGTGVLGFTE